MTLDAFIFKMLPFLDTQWKYIAMDCDGRFTLYTRRPTESICNDGWRAERGVSCTFMSYAAVENSFGISLEGLYADRWHESLVYLDDLRSKRYKKKSAADRIQALELQ